jgi:hypothetical protein
MNIRLSVRALQRISEVTTTVTIWSQYGVSPCAATRVWGSIPPTSTNITHYNAISYLPDGGVIPPTPILVSLYPPITLNNVKWFWARFGHSLHLRIGIKTQVVRLAPLALSIEMSRAGELPKRRPYSRLNCDGLSYPTSNEAVAASNCSANINLRASFNRNHF